MQSKYDPDNLFFNAYNYDVWFENYELTDTTRKIDTVRLDKYDKEFVVISNMPALEDDKEVQEETR